MMTIFEKLNAEQVGEMIGAYVAAHPKSPARNADEIHAMREKVASEFVEFEADCGGLSDENQRFHVECTVSENGAVISQRYGGSKRCCMGWAYLMGDAKTSCDLQG